MMRERILEIFEHEKERLVGFVRRRINDDIRDDAEDIVEDVLLDIYERSEEYEPIEDLSSYIYASLRNRIIDMGKKRKPTVSLDVPMSEDSDRAFFEFLASTDEDAFFELSRKQENARVIEALESLSDDEMAVVIETELNERTFGELADEWDVPIGTLLSRKSRALKKMRDILTQG